MRRSSDHDREEGLLPLVAATRWLPRRLGLDKFYSRLNKDTVNYCVLINRLLELMGDELIQLKKQQQMYGGRTV